MSPTKRHILFLFGIAFLSACGVESPEALEEDADNLGEAAATTQPITWVDQSKVERQSIGNCWLYATASWLESLNKAATGQEMNSSQSYTTYWHWFEQIANEQRAEVRTGGSYEVAIEIYTRYGVMLQADFIPAEATSEMSARQASALAAINASLKSGKLSTAEARRNRKWVRAELDAAWGLDADAKSLLNKVFGSSVSRTLDRSYTTKKPPSHRRADGVSIRVLRTVDIPAWAKNPNTENLIPVTLADVIGSPSRRTYAWHEANYPSTPSARRALQKRIQAALHDHQPVIMSWFVDFNAMGRDGSFSLEELARRGRPGSQGGHMVVMHDYQAQVPGFGLLKAGIEETRPEALKAALRSDAVVEFFRVKNSWGAHRPDRWDEASIPGYHDLKTTYLNGPIKKCATKADGSTDTSNCNTNYTPFWDVVLPAGY